MNRFQVLDALREIRDANKQWAVARREYTRVMEKSVNRLILEAATNRIALTTVASASGLTTKRIRAIMRDHGVNPRQAQGLITTQAAEALVSNAEAMGLPVGEMDLTSPLAYLPMGETLAKELAALPRPEHNEFHAETLAQVTHIIAEASRCDSPDEDCQRCLRLAKRIIRVVQGSES